MSEDIHKNPAGSVRIVQLATAALLHAPQHRFGVRKRRLLMRNRSLWYGGGTSPFSPESTKAANPFEESDFRSSRGETRTPDPGIMSAVL